jgi:exonuclease SbcC
VLAIRGRNLTSLAGEFAVDFEAEPLASAGIFAITGPTGAGKSTLLDAVCLALFNQVPRLESAVRGQVGPAGGESLQADDPRGLLRHRAGEGFAEVDFVGVDGGRYRARWSVKRARLRPDGRLQAVDQTFTNLETGHVYGGTRTETLQAIREKVGLTAQQFGRAVMLAQGDFDAFIDADSNTRAELLEKLTGTDLYARLGMAARARADRHRGILSDLEMRIAAQNGFDDVRRAEAEERLDAAKTEHDAAREIVARRERDRVWHARARELTERVRLAELSRDAAERRRAEAGPRRERLAAGRIANSLVPAWRALNEADARLASSVLRVADLEEASTTADGRASTAAESEVQAVEARRAAAHALELVRPDLEAARALDDRLIELNGTLDALGTARLHAEGEAEASASHRSAAVATLRGATEERTSVSAWLEVNEPRERISARRDDLAAGLAEHADVAVGAAEMQAVMDDLAIRRSSAGCALSDASTAVTETRRSLEAAERACETARAAMPTTEATAAADLERDRLIAVEPRLLALERCDADVARIDGAVAADRAEAERLERQVAAAAARRSEIDAAMPSLLASHDEAKRAAALSAAASGDAAARLRASLTAGEPCPVCGGTDHAVAALSGLIDGRAAADAERVAELAEETAAVGRERAVLEDRIRQDGGRIEAATTRLGAGATALAEAIGRRDAASAALASVLEPIGIAPGDTANVRNEVAARLDRAEGERRLAAAAREADRLAAAALETARTASTRAGEVERRAESELRDLAAEHAIGSDRHAALLQRREALASELDLALGAHVDWRNELDPAAALDRLVEDWRSRALRLSQIDAQVPDLTEAAHQAEVEHGRNAARLESAVDAVTVRLDERDRVAASRAALLNGRPVVDVADRLTGAVDAASSIMEAKRLASADARTAAVAARTRHDQAVRSLDVELIDAATRRAAFDGELSSRAVDEALVAEVAATGEAALEVEARTLEEIERAFVVAGAELVSRIGDRDAHDATQAPAVPLGEIEAALRDAVAAEAAARATLGEAELVVRQDDRAREATAALRATLEQERTAAQPWLQLDVLIGDATGNKFRRYAQGLTLERLLLHANVRLGELKPRYSLERAPGGDMLVQVVDHDMAGEVRGLPNLSGGERFLVSLALALGLSEMSTGNGLRVESLFIDEGFGALDGASLGQAIGMLEQLHATGRRVGVISHIEDVKERIAVKIAVSPAPNGSSAIEIQG